MRRRLPGRRRLTGAERFSCPQALRAKFDVYGDVSNFSSTAASEDDVLSRLVDEGRLLHSTASTVAVVYVAGETSVTSYVGALGGRLILYRRSARLLYVAVSTGRIIVVEDDHETYHRRGSTS